MKIIFVRHGKDDDGYRGGWSNLDLVPEGIVQSKLLAKHIKENENEYRVCRIISSDLRRTLSTAKYISEALNLPIQSEYQLREINNGDLAGMLNEDALKLYPGLFFNSLKMDETYPNGESPKEFYIRIKKWFNDTVAKYKNTNDNILVVTHSGVINIIYHLVNEIEWSNKKQPFAAGNCSMHILNVDSMTFEIENKMDF